MPEIAPESAPEIAIVGLGSWGLCILERLLDRARGRAGAVTIHVVQPGTPGPGVHALDEPDYLLMNTVCGQVSSFAASELSGASDPRAARSLFAWAVDHGFRVVDGECRRAAPDAGRALTPHDFLPRCVLGEYLAWVYGVLVAELPAGVIVHHHACEAIDVERAGARERIALGDGSALEVDHVFLTTGHTANREVTHPFVRPYPTTRLTDVIVPGATVAIAGLGLVAVDVLAALTLGRGGRFTTDGDGRKRYLASGREPRIVMYSRNGLPFCCRPASSLDATGSYQPSILTHDAVTALRHTSERTTGSPRLDLRRDVLPLMWAEMTVAYYSRSAALADGGDAAAEVERTLLAAWRAGELPAAVATLAARYGAFDAEACFFRPALAHVADRATYQAGVRGLIEEDVRESARGEARSPLKSALELFRVLRDILRFAVDYGGLTSESAREFRERIAPMINRVIVGPPLRRGQELLALLDAGVVEMPFGGSPHVVFDPAGGWQISSTRLATPYHAHVDHVVAGFLEQPSVDRSASPVLSRLFAAGRVRAFQGECGIDVSRRHHPIDAHGEESPRLWALGPLADGARYFNHYIPSPRSRFRAFRDADDAARSILGLGSP